jgi:predicted flap endonuclease-1-like 5' DNA nuclease
MRTDYVLYGVAIVFFIITGTMAVYQDMENQRLWIVGTVVLGFFFVGLGYVQRPKVKAAPIEIPPPPPQPVQAETVAKEITKVEERIEKTELPPTVEITQVKGVKARRAEQLKAFGVSDVEDLANASANDLARKLKISPKFTEEWIENAKELLKKS